MSRHKKVSLLISLLFPDTLVNNPGDLWNVVVSYCVISRKLCHNTQVRNSFRRLMESGYIKNLAKWEQIGMCYKQAVLLWKAQWMVVSEAGTWQLLQLIWLCCWFIYVTCMRHWWDLRHCHCVSWLWDSARSLLRMSVMAPLLPSLQQWRQDSTWGLATRFQPLVWSNLLHVVSTQSMAPGLGPMIWTLVDKGVKNLKKQKN